MRPLHLPGSPSCLLPSLSVTWWVCLSICDSQVSADVWVLHAQWVSLCWGGGWAVWGGAVPVSNVLRPFLLACPIHQTHTSRLLPGDWVLGPHWGRRTRVPSQPAGVPLHGHVLLGLSREQISSFPLDRGRRSPCLWGTVDRMSVHCFLNRF